MRTIAWNCRSAGRALTVRALKELIRESNLDRVFLSETKIKSKRINKICDRLKFVDSWCVDANGLFGDLVLFWRSGVDVEVVFSNKNMIVALVYSNPPEAPWLLFAIYGPNQRSKKEKFWEMLENMVSTFSGPWVVIRDLNCIKRAKKKRGGYAVTESSVSHLRDFMSNTGAINLGFTGPSFTWSNRREGLANIKERLDQGLCDQECNLYFPKQGSNTCVILTQIITRLCLIQFWNLMFCHGRFVLKQYGLGKRKVDQLWKMLGKFGLRALRALS